MKISKDKIEKAITLKNWYSEKLSEVCPNDPDLGHEYHRDSAERFKRTDAFEATGQSNLLKEFLEGLSEAEIQELRGIAYYGRDDYKNFATALEASAQMEQTTADIQYTMGLLATNDYLETGFDKLNVRREI